MLHQIVYVSSSRNLDISDFVNSSLPIIQKRNAERNITGMLLFSEGTFLQVLEGNRADLDDIYEGIRKDGRHKQIINLLERETEQRSFPDWSMGWRRIDRDHPLAEEVRKLGDVNGVRDHAENINGSIMTLIESYFSVNRD